MKDLSKDFIDLLNELEINLVDESQARQSYFTLLRKLENNRRSLDNQIYEKYRSDIEEIISEEMKHSKMLDKMIHEISGIIPEE